MNRIFSTFIFGWTALLPTVAAAATFRDASEVALGVVSALMQTLFALVSLGIIYTVYRYINAVRNGDKDATRFRAILIWAIVGLAVAFSLWGIVTLLANTFGWSDVGIPQLEAPTVTQ
jgi:ABC-type nickel/cobalt efflux system permease component RcnA